MFIKKFLGRPVASDKNHEKEYMVGSLYNVRQVQSYLDQDANHYIGTYGNSVEITQYGTAKIADMLIKQLYAQLYLLQHVLISRNQDDTLDLRLVECEEKNSLRIITNEAGRYKLDGIKMETSKQGIKEVYQVSNPTLFLRPFETPILNGIYKKPKVELAKGTEPILEAYVNEAIRGR